MHRPNLLAASLLLLVSSTAACTDFVLDGPSTRTAPPPPTQTDGRVIVLVDGGAAPPPPGQDAGVPKPDAYVPPPTPDSGVPKPDTMQPDTTPPPPTGACGNDYESEVFALVNQERAKVGKAPFQCDLKAGLVARNYSKYMCEARFFSHTGLDGSSPWSRLQDGGVQFRSAGENIAAGQQTPASVMNSWMNSSGHRANILGSYSHIGIGYHPCPGGKFSAYWTQSFVTP